MQLYISDGSSKPPGFFKVICDSARQHGIRSLYTGLSASLLRQMTYSLVRLGAYEELKSQLSQSGPAGNLKLLTAASIAGALGGIAGNPAGASTTDMCCWTPLTNQQPDIVLVRMTTDATRLPEKQYGYRNSISGVFNIVKEEGLKGLARGLGANTVRILHPGSKGCR